MFSNDPHHQARCRGILVNLIRSGAISVELFLHRRFGIHYVRQHAALSLVLMLLYWYCWPQYESGPFVVFCGIFLANCCFTQLDAWIRFLRGDNEHSRYSGFPRFLRRELAHRQYRVKQFAEPMMIYLIAFLAYGWNRPLAIYWMIGAACCFFSSGIDRAWHTSRAISLHDSVIEQRQSAARFREIHGQVN